MSDDPGNTRTVYRSMAEKVGVFISRDLLDFLVFQKVTFYDFNLWLRSRETEEWENIFAEYRQSNITKLGRNHGDD